MAVVRRRLRLGVAVEFPASPVTHLLRPGLPAAGNDPDSPVAILRALPGHYHQQFIAEYRAAAEAAREPEGYEALQALLRLWRLTAVAVTAREAARTGRIHEGSVPIEDIVPDWSERLAQA